MSTIEERVIKQITLCTDKEIKLDSELLNDLNMDSLDILEFIMHLESEFECEIDDKRAMQFTTVQQFVDEVASLFCSKINNGYSCTMPKGSECPDCCGIRGETIGAGD